MITRRILINGISVVASMNIYGTLKKTNFGNENAKIRAKILNNDKGVSDENTIDERENITSNAHLKERFFEVSKMRGTQSVPVVILHGWGSNRASWLPVMKILDSQGFEVIAPDLPGFGESDFPKKPWNVQNYVDCVTALLETLNLKKVILLGHSFGGRICIKFSHQYPEKVQKLILVASAGIKHPPTPKMKILSLVARFGKKIVAIPVFGLFASTARRALYRLAGSRDYLVSGPNRETFLKVIEEDLRPHLPKILAQTLLIWGDKDLVTPLEDAKIMKSAIPDSELVIFPGIHHSIQREAPVKLAETVISFLK
ncbi:alpha/beta hydrolase [Candidatus Peregrinibacteria bacterium]|nr:alpha/beta hydrolase [Candidatus Peregrinibacteria bacterium]